MSALLLLSLLLDPAQRRPVADPGAAIQWILPHETGAVLLTAKGVHVVEDTDGPARRVEGLPEIPFTVYLNDLAVGAAGEIWENRAGTWTYLGDLRAPVHGGLRAESEILLATQIGLLGIDRAALGARAALRAPGRSGSVANFFLGLGGGREPGEAIDRSVFRVRLRGPVFSIARVFGRIVAEDLGGSNHVRSDDGSFSLGDERFALLVESLPRPVRRRAYAGDRRLALLVDGSVHLRETDTGWRRILAPESLGAKDRVAAIAGAGDEAVWVGTRGGKLFYLRLDRLRDED